MPKSKNRRKNGKKKEGRYKGHSRADVRRIQEAYQRKLQEYSELSLEELTSIDLGSLGGGYRLAYLQVLQGKKIQEMRGGESTAE